MHLSFAFEEKRFSREAFTNTKYHCPLQQALKLCPSVHQALMCTKPFCSPSPSVHQEFLCTKIICSQSPLDYMPHNLCY